MEGLSLLILFPLGFIIYEDFRYRAIHWIWLLVLIVIVLYFHKIPLTQSLTNLTLIAIQLTLLSLYFSLKEKKFSNIINRYLGIGDILFLIPLCFIFSPFNFMLFLSVAYLLTLCFGLVVMRRSPNNTFTIPLAGAMSIVLGVCLLGAYCLNINLNDDHQFFLWLLS